MAGRPVVLSSTCITQAVLFGGNSADEQLGDVWEFNADDCEWSKLSVHAGQAKAWHQTLLVPTNEVESSIQKTAYMLLAHTP